MGGLARLARVVEGVVLMPLHPHDLRRGVLQVVDLYKCVRPGLNVRTDIASWGDGTWCRYQDREQLVLLCMYSAGSEDRLV